jgi:hypothetical protein
LNGFVISNLFLFVRIDKIIDENVCRGPGDRPEVLLIDLRNNGGGLLQGAVETSNLLLKPGQVDLNIFFRSISKAVPLVELGKIAVFVVSKDGQPQALQTLPHGIDSSDPDLPDLTTPVYLLVDSNTASAAEVFAAAMRVREDTIDAYFPLPSLEIRRYYFMHPKKKIFLFFLPLFIRRMTEKER